MLYQGWSCFRVVNLLLYGLFANSLLGSFLLLLGSLGVGRLFKQGKDLLVLNSFLRLVKCGIKRKA